MELDSSLSSLLQNLKLDSPLLPPKTWESVSSESGAAASVDPILCSTEPNYDPSTISEAGLVRLVINALQGVRSSLDDIERLSASFCLSPADRTSHRVPCLWHRSSSTKALGKLLQSVLRSGLVFFLLHKFVDHFLGTDHRDVEGQNREKNPCDGGSMASDPPPYSLVNQAFAVAVGKVLEGYVCSLNTLFASVELRRSSRSVVGPEDNLFCLGSLTSIVHSQVTVLEVYLHTTELRTHIEALGNICMLRVDDLAFLISSGEGLTAKAELLELDNFPRGADLLSYLYVQLRDADPVHRALLKFLFVRSCEPYCAFIKAWIFKARISDPYQEFIIEFTDNPRASNDTTGYTDNLSPDFVKERPRASIPCFLKEICLPLLRAGQQLQVLMKLLVFRNHSITGGHNYGGAYILCDLATVEEVLPFLNDSSNNSVYCLSKLTFCREDLEIMIGKREAAYRMMWDRLQIFFTRLDVRSQQVTPYDFLPSLDRRTDANVSSQSMSDESFIFSPSTIDKESTNVSMDLDDSDISSTSDESSYEMELLQPSRSSSISISEEHNRTGESIEPCDIVIVPIDLFASSLSTSYAKENVLLKPPRSETLRAPEFSSWENAIALTNQHHEDGNLSPILVPHQSGDSKCGFSVAIDDNYQSVSRWLLGGLSKNPFYADGKYRGQRQLRFDDCGQKMIDRNTEKEGWKFEKIFVLDSEMEQISRRTDLMNGCSRTSSNMCSPQSWNSQLNYNLNANPMLTKAAWLQTLFKKRDKNVMGYRGSSLSYFDFSFIENPHKVFSGRMPACSDHGCIYEDHTLVNSGYSSLGVNENVCDRVPIEHTNQSVLDRVCSTSESEENFLSEAHSERVSGGAKWERLLRRSGKEVIHTSGGFKHGSMATSEMPLDVIIERCVVQEVLLQYKYISSFTIKLLEEGFDLHEHLLALRRYHFMELADWADSFMSLLWNHKWHINEPKQRIIEIQGLLDLALQRSSCESDPYKERLSICTKGHTLVPLSTSAMGIQAFDYIVLGYRVDWPISIVITQDALKIYAEIFSFLMQVRLAVFSLTDMWHSFKGLMHSTNRNRCVGGQDMNNFNALMEIRQQVSHFVFTLQRYVHSQLSDVSWCRFLQSIKHQVKDTLGLESVHMSYLADALHICFLSAEMQTVACIIKIILQCALDFRLCFPQGDWKVRSDGLDSSSLHGRVNFPQVFAIKATFERNLKDLHACYLKSPKKHGEFGLGLFWGYLNYNSYYS